MGYKNHTYEYPGFSTTCAGNYQLQEQDKVLVQVAPTLERVCA
jgi:hypothetical protein